MKSGHEGRLRFWPITNGDKLIRSKDERCWSSSAASGASEPPDHFSALASLRRQPPRPRDLSRHLILPFSTQTSLPQRGRGHASARPRRRLSPFTATPSLSLRLHDVLRFSERVSVSGPSWTPRLSLHPTNGQRGRRSTGNLSCQVMNANIRFELTIIIIVVSRLRCDEKIRKKWI